MDQIGAESTFAKNGLLAVDEYKANHDKFDIILMDYEMPRLNGLEAAKAIRGLEEHHNWPKIPIIALTAHVQAETTAACIAAGMDNVLNKPLNLDALAATINTYIKSK